MELPFCPFPEHEVWAADIAFVSREQWAAWDEDDWRRIRIGAATFRVAKPCGRCQVTTIDQATAQRGRQPLALLGRRRRFGKQLVFGQNMIPDSCVAIRVGDPVEVLERAGARHPAVPARTAAGPARA